MLHLLHCIYFLYRHLLIIEKLNCPNMKMYDTFKSLSFNVACTNFLLKNLTSTFSCRNVTKCYFSNIIVTRLKLCERCIFNPKHDFFDVCWQCLSPANKQAIFYLYIQKSKITIYFRSLDNLYGCNTHCPLTLEPGEEKQKLQTN